MSEPTNAIVPASQSIYAKLAGVMLQLQRLPKSGTNREQNYKFATDADILDAVRGKLAEAGIAFLASMTDMQQNETGAKTKSGTPIIHTVCKFEYRFVDGETGEMATNIWTGESLEWSDKGISKAATSALKYFLLKTFMISTGEPTEDPDSRTIPGGKAKQNKSTEPPPVPPPAAPATASSPATTAPPQNAEIAADLEADSLQDKDNAIAFVNYWRGQGLTDTDILKALEVSKISEWVNGRKAADAQIADYIEAQLPAVEQA